MAQAATVGGNRSPLDGARFPSIRSTTEH